MRFPEIAGNSKPFSSVGDSTIIHDPIGDFIPATHPPNASAQTVADDAGHRVTTYHYDSQNRLTAVETPDGRTLFYCHDSEDNEIGEIDMSDPLSRVTTYEYDWRGKAGRKRGGRANHPDRSNHDTRA